MPKVLIRAVPEEAHTGLPRRARREGRSRALDAELVTADRRLVAAPGIRCRVRLVPPE